MSDQNQQENEWAKREIGALWVKESTSQQYMSGHFTDQDGNRVKVVIFTNKHKKKDTHPDYRIYKSAESGGQPSSQPQQVQAAPVQQAEAASAAVEEELI